MGADGADHGHSEEGGLIPEKSGTQGINFGRGSIFISEIRQAVEKIEWSKKLRAGMVSNNRVHSYFIQSIQNDRFRTVPDF